MIVLDTHVLVWFAEDHPRLGARTTKLTDTALQRDEVLVSAISFWEIAMLANKQRLTLLVSLAAMRRSVLEQLQTAQGPGCGGTGRLSKRALH